MGAFGELLKTYWGDPYRKSQTSEIKKLSYEQKLRKRLHNWYNHKSKTVAIVDLLQSDYGAFRRGVAMDLKIDSSLFNFKDAIKKASLQRLEQLDNIILDSKIDRKK